ncbi:hypothetical protein [Brevundimonas pishanensis]|uniref:hypothetical protein n=1 Tax=Brevundimonas pishanensis TaxID=2896315 RepID=UPI001FA7D7AD|nr:hypothetical protein [Brevundimonas pishanensis]
MKTLSKIGVAAIAPALALTLMASPASAQRYHDRDRGNDAAKDAVLGAVVGGLAGAIIGNGDGRYVAGGALAGAAVGAASSDNRSDCNYYRGGRCYRNQGHWERENGINSRDRYSYDRRDYRGGRYDQRDRGYRYDRRW